VEQVWQPRCHLSTRIKDGFAVLPKRWMVERTVAWLGNCRRWAQDVEDLAGRVLTATAEHVVRVAMLKLTLAKLH
jgi:putative transposase